MDLRNSRLRRIFVRKFLLYCLEDELQTNFQMLFQSRGDVLVAIDLFSFQNIWIESIVSITQITRQKRWKFTFLEHFRLGPWWHGARWILKKFLFYFVRYARGGDLARGPMTGTASRTWYRTNSISFYMCRQRNPHQIPTRSDLWSTLVKVWTTWKICS